MKDLFETLGDMFAPKERPEFRKDIYGWFDSALQDTPTHDPGLNTICPICANKLSAPLKTISFCNPYENIRSYFYRTHKGCYENASEETIAGIEGVVIDSQPIYSINCNNDTLTVK